MSAWATTTGGVVVRDLEIVASPGQVVTGHWPSAAEAPTGLAMWPGRTAVGFIARCTGYSPGPGVWARWVRHGLLMAEEDNTLTLADSALSYSFTVDASWYFLVYGDGSELTYEVSGSPLFDTHFLLRIEIDLLKVDA